MNLPDTIELHNIDPEDVCDVLLKVEKSFGFKFGDTELKHVKTFGELCDIVVQKVHGENSNDCTSQQGFYKLRNAIVKTLEINPNSISFDTSLPEIFPKRNRRKQIALLQKELGIKLNLLQPKGWITTALIIMLLASIVFLFIFWQVGVAGLVFSIAGLKISYKFGKELDLQTNRELAAKISRENYFAVRRDPSTVNKKEIVRTITEIFSKDLGIDKSLLTREVTFH